MEVMRGAKYSFKSPQSNHRSGHGLACMQRRPVRQPPVSDIASCCFSPPSPTPLAFVRPTAAALKPAPSSSAAAVSWPMRTPRRTPGFLKRNESNSLARNLHSILLCMEGRLRNCGGLGEGRGLLGDPTSGRRRRRRRWRRRERGGNR